MEDNVGVAVAFVVALAFLILGLAFVLPAGISGFHDPSVTTEHQAEDTGAVLVSSLEANVTAVNETEGTASVEFTDTATLASDNVSLNESESKTATIEGFDIRVTLNSIDDDVATLTYEYPTTYGWPDGALRLFGVLPVLTLSAIVIIGFGTLLKTYK